MSLLRILCPLIGPQQRCAWALVDGGAEPEAGEGLLAQMPRRLLQRAKRIELVIPASQVLITRARLPPGSGRRSASLLAYAVEESTASEPDANQVSWLGSAGDADVLAVVDRQGLENWRHALRVADIHGYAVCCETLMLPLPAGGWSCAWDGREGFVRTGEFEGAATDSGDRESPPLSLCLMLEDAKARNEAPASIALYVTAGDAAPDVAAWQRILGVTILPAQAWDWRAALPVVGISLAQEHRRWRLPAATLSRLRPVAWIAGIALALHAVALVVDWTRLAGEQRTLRTQMEARFRAAFPDTVAVADPALQMRRKLAEARRAANRADDGDFAVMIAKVAAGLKELPAGAVRTLSYENGRMTLELAVGDEALVRRISARLSQAGLSVETVPAAARTGRDKVTMTVKAS